MIAIPSIVMAILVPILIGKIFLDGRIVEATAVVTSNPVIFVMSMLCLGFAISGWVLLYLTFAGLNARPGDDVGTQV